ncbi:hypothetical protein [Micromonospora endolithica]|uniref:DUF2064 domain-containing protein n=1 Tax=Micromonospora endolithica TaxID=230091 RepID=A0A3A9YV64_9ACTN|nr:hypothetical protein [Micromonospora endolithica]RKN39912.1 hypothetical protein D7223_27590 [Micromonospora endolithica]TWJ26066.1 hypothetical protein JD76_06244 [Micromonospora endolithica]
MGGRVVVALLAPVAWSPPGVDLRAWRTALAEDVVDLLATLQQVETAVAVLPGDRWLADAVVWPGTTVYEVAEATPSAVLALFDAPHAPDRPTVRAADAGTGAAAEPTAGARQVYDQVAVIAGDAPDVPGLTIGKLLRPLTTRPVAVAPVEGDGSGLLGIAVRLPVPAWLPPVDLGTARPAALRAAAPSPGDLAVTPAWRRLRGPADLAWLDPAVQGWEATRALLSGSAHRAQS